MEKEKAERVFDLFVFILFSVFLLVSNFYVWVDPYIPWGFSLLLNYLSVLAFYFVLSIVLDEVKTKEPASDSKASEDTHK